MDESPINFKNTSTTEDSGASTGCLTYQLLTEITDNFSKELELGKGASGMVYKGVMKNGEEIAVKLLSYNKPGVDDQQFQNELNNLMMLRHPNTVRFVGYCNETQLVSAEFNGKLVLAEAIHRALCFEYLPGGSLKLYLSDESCGLDWNTRYKIINGICKGLEYLHKGLGNPIYHLDLKPENILLDNYMVPKIADFGLSKIRGDDISRTTANSYGTCGYIPPEFIERNIISSKFDIFSLGVIIIKILTGPKGYDKTADMSNQDFIDLAQGKWRNKLQENWKGYLLEAYCHQIKTCIELALNCVQKDRKKRPDITAIVDKLRRTEILFELLKVHQQDKHRDFLSQPDLPSAQREPPQPAPSVARRTAAAAPIRRKSHRRRRPHPSQEAPPPPPPTVARAAAASHRFGSSLIRALGASPPSNPRRRGLAAAQLTALRPPPHAAATQHATNSATSSISAGSLEEDIAATLSLKEVTAVMERIGLAASGRRGEGLVACMGHAEFSSLFDTEEPSFTELRSAFAVFDNDCDGFISAADLQVVLAKLGVPKDNTECNSMIKASGGSQDGRMSLFQFTIHLENGLCSDLAPHSGKRGGDLRSISKPRTSNSGGGRIKLVWRS